MLKHVQLKYIPPEMRTCLNCNRKETEDEFHVVIACPKYSSFRDDLFQKLNKYFNEYGDEEKFIWIMSNEDIDQMKGLGTFITKLLKSRTK